MVLLYLLRFLQVSCLSADLRLDPAETAVPVHWDSVPKTCDFKDESHFRQLHKEASWIQFIQTGPEPRVSCGPACSPGAHILSSPGRFRSSWAGVGRGCGREEWLPGSLQHLHVGTEVHQEKLNQNQTLGSAHSQSCDSPFVHFSQQPIKRGHMMECSLPIGSQSLLKMDSFKYIIYKLHYTIYNLPIDLYYL